MAVPHRSTVEPFMQSEQTHFEATMLEYAGDLMHHLKPTKNDDTPKERCKSLHTLRSVEKGKNKPKCNLEYYRYRFLCRQQHQHQHQHWHRHRLRAESTRNANLSNSNHFRCLGSIRKIKLLKNILQN